MRAAGMAIAAAALLAGCAQVSESYTGRTATEQLLLARAADRAVEGLELPVPKSARIFVDNAYFQAEGAPYAVSAVRQALSEAGHPLANDRNSADVILEMRAGSLALEQMRRVVGLPSLAVPINENLNVVSLPELSLYSRRDRTGVAEFSAFVYDARTGAPLGVVQPMVGEYRIRSHKVLMIITWGQQWAEPGEADLGDSWTAF
jgi:hypothetical protein